MTPVEATAMGPSIPTDSSFCTLLAGGAVRISTVDDQATKHTAKQSRSREIDAGSAELVGRKHPGRRILRITDDQPHVVATVLESATNPGESESLRNQGQTP
jgi:hypothetical protein